MFFLRVFPMTATLRLRTPHTMSLRTRGYGRRKSKAASQTSRHVPKSANTGQPRLPRKSKAAIGVRDQRRLRCALHQKSSVQLPRTNMVTNALTSVGTLGKFAVETAAFENANASLTQWAHGI